MPQLSSSTDSLSSAVTNAQNRTTYSLNGDDNIGRKNAAGTQVDTRVATSQATGISLSGTDTVRIAGGSGRTAAGGGVSTTLWGPDTTVAAGSICRPLSDPYYEFSGTISEEVLHRYLDRSLQVELLSKFGNASWADGPSYPSAYNPLLSPANNYLLYYTSDPSCDPGTEICDHGSVLNMIVNSGAKHVWDLAHFWGGPVNDTDLNWICDTLRIDIDFIHCHDTQVICGAAIPEFGSFGGISGLTVPDTSSVPLHEYAARFYNASSGYPSGRPGLGPYFDFNSMVSDPSACPASNGCYFDMTKPEAQMYYYYIATRFIDSGCETIHFGDLWDVCAYDNGNINLWYVTEQIRAYAANHARRGVVLLDAHSTVFPKTPYGAWFLHPDAWVYDPSRPYPEPAPTWQTRLIFDYHSLGTIYTKNADSPCYDDGIMGNAILPVTLNNGSGLTNGGLINQSRGGLNPQGWYCVHNPALSRYDNGNNIFPTGCGAPGLYNYDNDSWFATQREDLRQLILKYTYYRVKCLDPNGHFSMPGRLIAHYFVGGTTQEYLYNAYTEAATIKNIWNNVYAHSSDWIPHDFTAQNVADGPDIGPASSLIVVGDDKIYYIGTDGYIHGYIRVNSDINSRTWLTVSPSYACQLSAAATVKAQGDLVASPDGTHLLYIGTDGYIHAFDIIDVWRYYYSDFMKSEMVAQQLTAVGSLIYPGNDRIFYIATYPTFNDSNRVHGFQKSSGIWQTTSPTYSAEGAFGQSILGQTKAAGALTYRQHTGFDRIYYRDIFGLISYYEVHDLITFYYVPCPGNLNLHAAGLVIVGNLAFYGNRIYFVAQNSGAYWVYCLIDTGTSSWTLLDVSANAAAYSGSSIGIQLQSSSGGKIAVSPDGNTVIYLPGNAYPWPCCYHNIDGYNYQYQQFEPQVSASGNWVQQGNSLQFTSDTDFFVVSLMFQNVIHFTFQEDYCSNPTIQQYFDYVPCGGWPPPDAVFVYLAGSLYIRLTFAQCGPVCNSWIVNYDEIGAGPTGDTGSYAFSIDCLDLPAIINIPVHPVVHVSLNYQYYLTNCCGMVFDTQSVHS